MDTNGGGGYRNFLTFSLTVLVAWGIVPWLAKEADFPGGFTTTVVNWSAALAVLLIMAITNNLGQLRQIQRYAYKFGALALAWPLAYSIFYFNTIKCGGGAIATITNYTWPVFAIALLWLTGSRMSRRALIVVMLALVALAVSTFLGDTTIVHGTIALALFLGLMAGFLQAVFNVETKDEEAYPGQLAWLLTLIGALVTAVGATTYTLLFENGQVVVTNSSDLLPLVIIGAFSNGIGFWAFLRAGQMSKTQNQKTTFLLIMMSVPLVQVFLLPIVGIEEVGWNKVLGLLLVVAIYVGYRIWDNSTQSHQLASASD